MTSRDIVDLRIKKAGFDSLYYFVKHILGYSLLDDNVHGSLCDFVQHGKGDCLILEPRDHFKTTCVSIGFTIWSIVKNPNIRILINHKVLAQSKGILSEIMQQFERNERLRYYYGNIVGDTWNTDKIVVRTRTANHKEGTVEVGAVDHEKTSSHYDMIINDDLVGLADMVSQASRDSVLSYYKTLKYLRDKQQFVKMVDVGTRWHMSDLYSYILEKRGLPVENIRIRKAIKDDGTPYFRTRYTIEELKRMEDDDPVMFSAVMQNEPRHMKGALYDIDKLKKFNYAAMGLEGIYTIGYIDPAFGKYESKEPCYFSFPILGIIGDDGYVLEWITNKDKPEQNEMLIVEMIRKYNLRQLGIESNAQQSEFIRNVQRTLRSEGIVLNIIPINHTTNKDRRIQGMHGTVVNNLYFRDDWQTAYPEPMSQLILYPQHRYKDGPDALEGVASMMTGAKTVRIRRIGSD